MIFLYLTLKQVKRNSRTSRTLCRLQYLNKVINVLIKSTGGLEYEL